MIRELAALAALIALGACASYSTDPEAANPAVRRLCYVERDPAWVQIPAPENAQAYRDAWTRSLAERGSPQITYVAPHWPVGEFWFRANGTTRLCNGRPFHHLDRCGEGNTIDFTESAAGIVASNEQEPVCL